MGFGPIDYSSNVETPFQAAAQGYQLGAGIRDDQFKQQQQQVALQQAAQQRQVVQALIANPAAGAKEFGDAAMVVPGLREHFKQAWEQRSAAQQESGLRDAGQVYAAVASGNHQVAIDMLTRRADSMEAAGAPAQQIQAARTQAQLIQAHPEFARAQIGLMLASVPGGDKVLSGATTVGTEARAQEQAPYDLAKKAADARVAVVTAGNAPTKTVLENEEGRQKILSAEAQRRVADFNSQIGAANSETERGQLMLARDKFVAEQAGKQAAAGTDLQDQFDVITQGLNTAKALRADLDDKWKWTGVGAFSGKVRSLIPGTDARDFRAKLETLKSQQFLAQAQKMKGLGALTEIEGAKIEKAVAALDADMSEPAFRTALSVIETNLAKGHAKLVASGKLPKNGGAFVMQHPVYGNVGDGDINRLMQQYPGTTREQVIEYLRSNGGK